MAVNIALLVVDVQVDFCPGGSLAVADGDRIIPQLNRVIEAFHAAHLPIFFSRDWHPPNHRSFKSQGGVWPPHCVARTPGAEFHLGLNVPPGSTIISKATEPDLEAYSAFQGTNLGRLLKERTIDEVVIGGLATDYCVKESALDAMKAGFGVSILKDCAKGVNLREDDSEKALRLIEKKGAALMTSEEAIGLSRRTAMKSSS